MQSSTAQKTLQTNSTEVYVFNSDGKLTMLESKVQSMDSHFQSISEPQDEDDLACVLKSWGLYDQLYIHFKGKNITTEALKHMKERHIDELFCGLNELGLKIVFENKLNIWQNDNGIYNLCITPQNTTKIGTWLDNIDSPVGSNAPENDNTTFEILNSTEQGKSIISSYKKNLQLTPDDRTNLVHKVIQHFTENGKKISVKRCEMLAHEIIKIFPNEHVSTYFTPGKNKIPPKGKLYDRYRGQRKSLGKLFKDDIPTKKPKPNEGLNNTEECTSVVGSLTEAELQKVWNELKHNRNWESVIEQWNTTKEFRRKSIIENKDKTIFQILQDWPLYRYSRAQELINMDFTFLKPDKKFNFEKWEKFCNIALDLFSERLKANFLKIYFKELKANISGLDIDNVNIAFVNLLHGLLPPTSRRFTGKVKKFTIEDSKNTFTLEIDNAAHIDSILDLKRKEYAEMGTNMQPIIICVGEKFKFHSFYVSIDNVKFEMQSYLDCIDLYFKFIYVLNIEYPKQCMSVWTFFQIFCFEIEEDEKIPSVKTFVRDVESLILAN